MLEAVLDSEVGNPIATMRDLAGKLIAVWGTQGGGKTVIALNLAMELALEGRKVLLVDLDTKNPALSTYLGSTGPKPRFSQVLRLSELERLNSENLLERCDKLESEAASFWFLPGIVSPGRWVEVTAKRLNGLFAVARQEFDYIVCDLASDIEAGLVRSDSISFRNEATGLVIETADLQLTVFQADPVGINRLLWQLQEVNNAGILIANQLRNSVVGRNGKAQIEGILEKYAQEAVDYWIPHDGTALDSAMQRGQPLWLASRSSKVRSVLVKLAQYVLQQEQ